MFMQRLSVCAAVFGMALSAGSAHADSGIEVKITQDLPYLDMDYQGRSVRVERIQDQENVLTGGFAKTSRKCPPFCIHPMKVADGVETVGEVEVINFIKTRVKDGSGALIDARTPTWFEKGTIPGSINIPFTVFEEREGASELADALRKLGVRPAGQDDEKSWSDSVQTWLNEWRGAAPPKASAWNFDNAKYLTLWCNGPWCDQSPRAIRALLAVGYPPEKISYYRGGMQLWQILGLTIVEPK